MANKKYAPKKSTVAHTKQVKKKKSNTGYVALLISLTVALVIFVGCALGVLLYNLPDETQKNNEQSTSSSVDDDVWSKNY